MKAKYMSLLATATLFFSVLRYGGHDPAIRPSENLIVFHDPGASGDTKNETRVIGKVTLSGAIPPDPIIKMGADPVCAKLHSSPAVTENIVLGPRNALANALVYVSEGLPNHTFDAPVEPAVLEQKGCQYRPHVIALMAGQKFLVENNDPTTHNIHPLPMNNREWNRAQAQGVAPLEATFDREEIAIPVKCNIHPWMKGYIAVLKCPFFAVTGKDGTFVLKDLPPGNYTITAWHEKLGTRAQKVTVTANQVSEVEFAFGPHSAY